MQKFLFLAFLLIIGYCGDACGLGQAYINNQCVPVSYVNGCASYRYDGQCDVCQHGYDKDIDGSCAANSNFNKVDCCSQRDLNGFCTKCAPGLYLDNKKCKRNNIDGCVTKQGPSCKACGKGFILINNKCTKALVGCEQYGITGTCIRCSPSILNAQSCQYKFQLYNGICIKLKSESQQMTNYVTKCKVKNSYGCIQCQDNFYLDQHRQCYPYEPGCLAYFKGKCKECSTYRGYYLDSSSGKCVYKYKNGVSNCAQYDEKDLANIKCIGCKQSYRLAGGQCSSESNLQVKIKKQCGSGYYLGSDYRCKVSSGNLIKQSDDTNNGIPLIKEPGCIYQYGKCQYCQVPFQKVDGKCTIPNCMELVSKKSKTDETYSCSTCRYPYQLDSKGNCLVANCAKYQGNRCALCSVGYHLKAGENCVKNDINCKSYDNDGNCQECGDKYFISSLGQCMLKQSNCLTNQIAINKMPVCTACRQGFFLNRNNQCQKLDPNCDFYVNGVCKTCKTRYFLYQYICFPYTVGCVKYNGKACIECKKGYTLFNQQCYNLKTLGMKLEGQDQHYDFDIYPIDITKSKYYIDNLSPVSALGSFIYSSAYSKDYINPTLSFDDQYYSNEVKRSNGWKALTNHSGQYAGFKLNQGEDSVTFYALQLQFVQKSQIKSFYLEYTKDGINWIRVDNRFIVEKFVNSSSPQYLKQNGIITIYFTGIYAQSIRIVIDEFIGWPACKIQFFYYDLIRFRKISNLKSLRYLLESIQSNYVDRLDNQLYINQKYFFSPQFECHAGGDLACFTGLQLCQARNVSSIDLVNENKFNTGLASYVSEFYITYSQNGRGFDCFRNCTRFQISQKNLVYKNNYQTVHLDLANLYAKNVRVYPTKWVGTPKLSILYDYQ